MKKEEQEKYGRSRRSIGGAGGVQEEQEIVMRSAKMKEEG